MSKHYPITSYDKHLSLKVNGVMWLIFLFLLRAYVIGLMSVVNMQSRTQLIDMVFSSRLSMSLSALSGIPVFLLIYAWTRRSPGAPAFVKWVWEKGAVLVAISAIANAGVAFFPLWLGTARKISILDYGQLFLCAVIVMAVYSSQYIKDCFADFPDDARKS